jgi:cytochrome c oxidase subunit 4
MSQQSLTEEHDGIGNEAEPHGGRPYVVAWVALLGLTLLSYGAHVLQLGAFAIVVALAIALIKAAVVLIVFMHLRREPVSIRCVAALNLCWVALLCLGIALDVVSGLGSVGLPAAAP